MGPVSVMHMRMGVVGGCEEADSAVCAAARQEVSSTPSEPDWEEELGPIPNYPEGPRLGLYQELCVLWGKPMPETEEVGKSGSLGECIQACLHVNEWTFFPLYVTFFSHCCLYVCIGRVDG